MAEISEYREWLASAPTERGVLETIQISHADFPSLFLANWDVQVTCKLQDVTGEPDQIFLPARFMIEPAPTQQSTEQKTVITMSAYDGEIYKAFKSMTAAQRRTEITLTPRLYWTDDQTTQLVNPAPAWNIQSVTANIETIQAELTATPLRIHKTGIYYTALQFPVLGIGT